MDLKEMIFTEGNSSEFEKVLRENMDVAIKHFDKELASIRTGRASTSLIEEIRVECYGQMMKLKELATLCAPEARLLTIQPWDKSVINSIEKAILTSDLGVNPANDGEVIRLQFPMLSSERRNDLIKILGTKTEDCRIAIRVARKDAHNKLREAEKDSLISEDFAMRLSNLVQKITDEYIEKVAKIHAKKEAELATH